MEDEPVFFIIGLIICPLGFLVGATGTIISALKQRRSEGILPTA
jgi:hypothetical protein